MNRMHKMLLSAVLVCAGCAGAGDVPDGDPADDGAEIMVEDRPRLWLSEDGDDVLVHFVRARDRQGPRVLELRLGVSGPVALGTAEPGAALARAGKELVAQQREPGVIRLVAYSASSTAELESGVIARLKLQRQGAGKAQLDFLTDRPLFAPAVAQEGLVLGDPLQI